MRNFFAKKIYEHIKKNKKIILLSADIGNRLFDKIKKDFPNNFEQNSCNRYGKRQLQLRLNTYGFYI